MKRKQKTIRFAAGMITCFALAMVLLAGTVSTDAASVKKPARPTITSAKTRSTSSITVKWKKAKRAKGYQVQVAKDSKFSKSRKTYKLTATTKVIKSLKSDTKYYVRVRAYNKAGKKTKYSKWSKIKSASTKHSHDWVPQKGQKKVLVYDQVPFSEAKYPQEQYVDEYKCMCGKCDNLLYGQLDFLARHMAEVNSPGWKEEIYKGRAICNSCKEDITDDINHIFWCGKGSYHVEDRVVETIEHSSSSHYEMQTVVTGYKCSKCGATK